MGKKLVKLGLLILATVALCYGFSEGMEWHRIAAVMIGGLCLGSVINNFK